LRLIVYDITGREVVELHNGEKTAGTYELIWNGKNNQMIDVASGIYFLQMEAESGNGSSYISSQKMLLIR